MPVWLYRAISAAASALASLRRRLIPPEYAALELGTGSWVALAVAAFCELGLPGALESGAKTPRDLAQIGCGDETMLFRLLRGLSAYGIVRPVGDGRFALDRTGAALTGKTSVAPMIRYANAAWHVAAYTRLADAIRSGEAAFSMANGKPLFEFLKDVPARRALFDTAMQSLVPLSAQSFANAYDFSKIARVVDIGGGTGLLLEVLRQRYPKMRGEVFELPEHDIFKEAPPPADAYVMSHMLHDWDDDACVRMLRSVRAAMSPQSRLLVHEIVAAPPGTRWTQDRISDLEMLTMLPGRERTRAEFEALLAAAGLRLVRVIATAAAESVIEVLPLAGHASTGSA